MTEIEQIKGDDVLKFNPRLQNPELCCDLNSYEGKYIDALQILKRKPTSQPAYWD